jgi:hypothetical protein
MLSDSLFTELTTATLEERMVITTDTSYVYDLKINNLVMTLENSAPVLILDSLFSDTTSIVANGVKFNVNTSSDFYETYYCFQSSVSSKTVFFFTTETACMLNLMMLLCLRR